MKVKVSKSWKARIRCQFGSKCLAFSGPTYPFFIDKTGRLAYKLRQQIDVSLLPSVVIYINNNFNFTFIKQRRKLCEFIYLK